MKTGPSIADRLKREALAAVAVGAKGTARLAKLIARTHVLPYLLWAAQVRQAQLAEEHRRVRLTQIQEEQQPLAEVMQRAEAERRQALSTSNWNGRIQAEAKIKEVRERILALRDEQRELEAGEKARILRLRRLEESGPEADAILGKEV